MCRPGRARRGILVAALATAALAASGCRARPRARAVDRVVVADTEAGARFAMFGVGEGDVAATALQALAQQAAFLPPDARAPRGADHRVLRVSVDQALALAAGTGGGTAARVAVTLELAPAAGGSQLRETGVGESAVRPGEAGVGAAFVRALRLAAADGARAIDERLRSGTRSDDDLVRDLASQDPAVRDPAVRTLAERRNPAAVPALIAQLSSPDPRAADRAVGALAEIGDRRAVPALIDLAHRRGGRDLAQIARIVGDMGGHEARSWLDTLAVGHEDPEVRAAAREALSELDSREGAKMAGPAR